MPAHVPAPNPPSVDYARRLQFRYVRNNVIGLGGLGLLQAALCASFGAWGEAGVFGGAALAAALLAFATRRFREGYWPGRAYVVLGEAALLVGCLGVQCVAPAGPAAISFVLPYIIVVLAFAISVRRITVLLLLAAAGYVLLPYVGLPYATAGAVPQLYTFTLTVIYCGILLLAQLDRARRHVRAAIDSIRDSEVGLYVEQARLLERARELERLNAALLAGNASLASALAGQAEVSRQLSSERDEEQLLNASIHRDLREPLGVIVALSEQIRAKIGTVAGASALAEYMGFAIDGGQRMTRMLDDLLAYTADRQDGPSEVIDLDDVLADVARDLANLTERTGAELQIGSLPTVTGYRTQLTQLFSNLITNALKFSRAGVAPVVRIGVVAGDQGPASLANAVPGNAADVDTGRMCVIEVADNGIGIPANQIDKIFGLFNRAHREHNYEGSGVGLALCRRIALAHGCNLTVASVPGEGTSFRLILPASLLQSPPAPRVMSGAASGPKGSQRARRQPAAA